MPSPRRAVLRLRKRSRAVEDADPCNKKSLPLWGKALRVKKTPSGRERTSPLPETFVPA